MQSQIVKERKKKNPIVRAYRDYLLLVLFITLSIGRKKNEDVLSTERSCVMLRKKSTKHQGYCAILIYPSKLGY